MSAPVARLRLVATAGRGEGRGHLARSLSLAEAAADIAIRSEIVVLRGGLSRMEAARAAAAGATVMMRELPEAGDGERLVVDLPDPAEVPASRLATATVFDDSGALRGHVGTVVQPSLPAWDGAGRATADRVLAGYSYAPLGRAVIDVASGGRRVGAGHLRLLVCFGGSDPHDVSARLAPALAGGVAWATTFVVGPDYRGSITSVPGLRVLRDPPGLPSLLAAADLAVLGAGTMKFEAAALGVPAVLVAAADDQLTVGPPFAATGAAVWAGDGRTVDPAAVRAAIDDLAADGAGRRSIGEAGRAAVGLNGARLIVEAAVGLRRSVEARDG